MAQQRAQLGEAFDQDVTIAHGIARYPHDTPPVAGVVPVLAHRQGEAFVDERSHVLAVELLHMVEAPPRVVVLTHGELVKRHAVGCVELDELVLPVAELVVPSGGALVQCSNEGAEPRLRNLHKINSLRELAHQAPT